MVLNLGHAQTVHHWRNRDISSPFIRLFYVKQGRAVFHLPEGDLTLSPGHIYMIPTYLPHSYECDPGFEFYYLFVFQAVYTSSDIFEQYLFPLEVRSNAATQLLFENYCMLYPQLNLPSKDADSFLNHMSYREYAVSFMKMAEYERLQLHGLVEILLSYFMKYAVPRRVVSDARIAHLLSYISENLSLSITIDHLADISCVTKSHLIKIFTREVGETPLQYVIRKKIQHAQTLLLSSTMSVGEIAKAVGFQDPSYFIRLFKKNIGFTPKEYREKLIG